METPDELKEKIRTYASSLEALPKELALSEDDIQEVVKGVRDQITVIARLDPSGDAEKVNTTPIIHGVVGKVIKERMARHYYAIYRGFFEDDSHGIVDKEKMYDFGYFIRFIIDSGELSKRGAGQAGSPAEIIQNIGDVRSKSLIVGTKVTRAGFSKTIYEIIGFSINCRVSIREIGPEGGRALVRSINLQKVQTT